MQHAAVLHVRATPDRDRLGVAAQHRPVPDARLLPKTYFPHHEGAGRDEGGRSNLGRCVAEGEQGSDAAYTSTSTASPWPPPEQSAASPRPPPLRLNS